MADATSQPTGPVVINTANSITSGLLIAEYPPVSGRGSTTTAFGEAYTGAAPASVAGGPTFAPNIAGTSGYSILAVGVRVAAGDDNFRKWLARVRGGGINSVGFGIGLDEYSQNRSPRAVITYGDSDSNTVSTSGSYLPAAAGQQLIMGATYQRNNAAGLRLFVDGSAAITSLTQDKNVFEIESVLYASDQNGGGENTSIPATLVALWNRTLSDAEMASLHANPWQIFEDTPADTTGPSFGAATLGFVTKTDTTVALTTSAAATDAVGVTGYEWSSDNGATYPFTSLTNSFTFTALAALTSYNFRVRAYDAAGNRSTHLSLTTSTYRAGDTGQNIVDDTVAIPGVQEEGFLYNDVVLPADAAKWFSYNITTPVVDTANLILYPNGSFIWTGLAADSFYYQLEVDGANVGSPQLVSLDPADGSQSLTFTTFTNINSFPAFTVASQSAIPLTFTTFVNTQTFYSFNVYRAGDPLPASGGKSTKLAMSMRMGL